MKNIGFLLIFISNILFGQFEIQELNINVFEKNNITWKKYNELLDIKTLIFSGKGDINGVYHTNNDKILFNGILHHKEKGIKVDFKNFTYDENIKSIISNVIKQVISIANFHYFRSNKKGKQPYEELAIEKENNTWNFTIYKESSKINKNIQDKINNRYVTLTDKGEIQKIITILKHKINDSIQKQNKFQDHYIEINLSSSKDKQKYSKITGEIINIKNKNKVEFNIDFK